MPTVTHTLALLVRIGGYHIAKAVEVVVRKLYRELLGILNVGGYLYGKVGLVPAWIHFVGNHVESLREMGGV